MKRVSAKLFFSVMWKGVCQSMEWFFGLFGYKKDGLYAWCLWRLFATCTSIVLGILAVVFVYSLCDTVYDKYYKDTHCYDPDCPRSEFIAKNIPVYIGEYGCVMQNTERGNLFRKYYLEYVCRAAHTYHLPLIIWDNNQPGSGNEHHAYFNHSDGSYHSGMQSLVQTMIKAATSDDSSYTLQSIKNNAPR